jgi:hypothetical protein
MDGKDFIVAIGNGGTIPEGVWALNDERSKPLLPGRQTLWIIKDDRQRFVWVTVVVNDQGVQVISNDGAYDAPPARVTGGPMTMQTIVTGPNSLKNFGEIEGIGQYFENCVLSDDGKRLVCTGELNAGGEVTPFIDDFDWFGEGPPSARV